MKRLQFVSTLLVLTTRTLAKGMAWRSSGSTNSELIDNLRNNRVFASQRAYDAMKSVDRGDFAPRAPYEDAPQRIGYNATVSAPHMVGRNGTVVGIEHMPQLVELSEKNIRKHHSEQLERGNVIIIEGDGRQGFAEKAPYNAIHVGAASKGVPKALTDQLAEGGRMMIPVEQVDGNQVFMQIDKINGKIEQKIVEHVIYVPLTSREEQWNRN